MVADLIIARSFSSAIVPIIGTVSWALTYMDYHTAWASPDFGVKQVWPWPPTCTAVAYACPVLLCAVLTTHMLCRGIYPNFDPALPCPVLGAVPPYAYL